jgi:hypothetical protein
MVALFVKKSLAHVLGIERRKSGSTDNQAYLETLREGKAAIQTFLDADKTSYVDMWTGQRCSTRGIIGTSRHMNMPSIDAPFPFTLSSTG